MLLAGTSGAGSSTPLLQLRAVALPTLLLPLLLLSIPRGSCSRVVGPLIRSWAPSAASSGSRILKTRAAFFIEASAMLSYASPLHDQLWAGVRRVGAPMTMYSPWAPYPHYCVGAPRPPSNNGTLPCKTSWNMTMMDEMVYDYLNATSFDSATPFFEFTQSPCWLWKDGDCSIPLDPHVLSYPSHKVYASGKDLVDPSRAALADYFGRLAAWYRSGGFVDECGTPHKNDRKVAIRYWGIENEGEHGAGDVATNIAVYDSIVAGIKRHEVGGEAPMKFLAVNQNFGNNQRTIESWVRTFLNRSNHADPNVPIDVLAFHGYFHGAGNEQAAAPTVTSLSSLSSPPLSSSIAAVQFAANNITGWHSFALAGSTGSNTVQNALFIRACSYDGFVTRALDEAQLGKGEDSSWFVAPGLVTNSSMPKGTTIVSFRSFPEKFCPRPGDQTSPCPFYLVVNSSTGRVHLARDDGSAAFARAASFTVGTPHMHRSAFPASSGTQPPPPPSTAASSLQPLLYSFAAMVDGVHRGALLSLGDGPATGTCAHNFRTTGEGNLVVLPNDGKQHDGNHSLWEALPYNFARHPQPPPVASPCDTWGLKDEDLTELFKTVDTFMEQTVDLFVSLRAELAPTAELAVSEFGVSLHRDIDSECSQVVALRPSYQLAAAAVMGYGFGLLAERGVDFVLQSQYTGHSAGTKFPSVLGGKLLSNYYPGLALYNWTTGDLQPRSVVNQIIVAHLKPGSDIIIPSGMNHSNSTIYALGFSSPDDAATRKLLLVNKDSQPVTVAVDSALRGATAWIVDGSYTSESSPREVRSVGEQLRLAPFATAVLVSNG